MMTNTTTKPPFAVSKKRVTFVHNQYNSPLELYSAEEIAQTLRRHASLLSNGAVGIDFCSLSPSVLKRSEVYKMLTEEQQEQQERRPWQLRNKKTSTSSDMKRVAWPPVGPHMAPEIPSTNEHDNGTASVLQQNGAEEIMQHYQNDTNRFSNQRQVSPGPKVAPPVPPKPGAREIANAQQSADYDSDNTMAANGMPEAFASNELVGERLLIAKPAPPPGLILLKKHAPISQEPQAVFNSQPVFKRATPVRMLGDMVWPPKGAGGSLDNSTQSPGVVRRQPKNYQEFFSSNQLPANFPTYRAPPGTQHFGLAEGENTTPM
ncbi:uncharacterized protein LOC130700256 [Daphnia carinata]|uniref:uncharacterized protein LOC130700256 n=1 Tax=Daphnia carinata TaxID=120202 RepID=UPI00257DFD8B|nr:uncharacterized protein LOC130700256 [Daphnia carinata]